ncbi:MAG: histidinol dehydrogenase [Thiotrichales bacterium]|nr:MAG: histidinol dehydrogenase [Thiotrichales bacterium]
MKILVWKDITTKEKSAALCRPAIKQEDRSKAVRSIITQVRERGDEALVELTKKYDNVTVKKTLVSEKEFLSAEELISGSIKKSMSLAIARLRNYHRICIPKNAMVNTSDGIICTKERRAIDKVGLYVPGGNAPLVSTLLMLAVPAKLAECETRIVCTPPDEKGEINPALLVAAKLCGIDTIFKVGGAQAIAAMAYGTKKIPKVHKIFGPGNAWVTTAKVMVSQDSHGAVIDMPAGPSEVFIIAEANANPEFIAADLLAQAEHGPDSQVMCVTTSADLAKSISEQVTLQLEQLSRKEIVAQSLKSSAIIVVKKLDTAFDISNQYAPEHLIMHMEKAENYTHLITNAGAVFLGQWAPETIGDYLSGSNHVLPTYGYTKTHSALSVQDFTKYISFQSISPYGLQSLGSIAMQLAALEGLDAHKNAVAIRLHALTKSSKTK